MSRRISISEPVSELRKIPIRECGEELVNYLDFCPILIHDRPRFDYRRETLLRRTVAEKLCQAAHALPKALRFAIVEGWRGPHIQRRMYLRTWNFFKERHPDWTETQLKRTVNRFTAPANHPKVPPPHSTGGALDLILADESGRPMELHSPYETFDPRAYPMFAKGLTEEAIENRRILREALASVGITNYPSEYWHYSYGDQGWAYRGGHPHAIYGPVTPPGWAPDPADDHDGPVVRVEYDENRLAKPGRE